MPDKGDQRVVRALNRRLLIKLLRESGPASRAELADRSGLSAAAVTRLTQDLIADEFVVEREVGLSTGGRPPVMLDLDTTRRVVAGLKVMEDAILGVLCDLKGNVIASARIRIRFRDAHRVLAAAAKLVHSLLAKTQYSSDRLVGVGLCIPGAVSWRTGTCRLSPFFGWRNLQVGRMLADLVGTQVSVDNDVNALAVAENLFGAGLTADHFAILTLGRGVGAGLVSDGAVIRGTSGAAGEFGHQVTQVGGLDCECGKRGCLEAYCGEHSIMSRVAQLGGEFATLTSVEFVERARAGHPRLQPLYLDMTQRLGVALANLVNLLDCELILIGGEAGYLDQRLVDDLVSAATPHLFDGLADTVAIRLHDERSSPTAWARGAASLAIEHVFDPFVHNRGAAIA